MNTPLFNFQRSAMRALGWTREEVLSFSPKMLRMILIKHGHPSIAEEIARMEQSGAILMQPVPAAEAMAWLTAPKK